MCSPRTSAAPPARWRCGRGMRRSSARACGKWRRRSMGWGISCGGAIGGTPRPGATPPGPSRSAASQGTCTESSTAERAGCSGPSMPRARWSRCTTVPSVTPLDLPEQELPTAALWIVIPPGLAAEVAAAGLDLAGGIHAVEHAAIGLLPLLAMCDRWDIGGVSYPQHPETGEATIFIYDGHRGGVGVAETGFELLDELLRRTLEAIVSCPCEAGCPSCIQSPKCGNLNAPLDKPAAVMLLRRLLGRVDVPSPTARGGG